jgi:hypothetical protein
MKHKNKSAIIILVLLLVGIIGGLFEQVRAQDNIVSYLDERFKQQNVPVKGIKIIQEIPLQLEITIQSSSDGSRGNPEDPINYHLVEREVVLARQKGYFVESLTRIFLSPQGREIAKATTQVKSLEFMFLDDSPSSITDSSTKTLVMDKINLYGMSALDISVDSREGLQTLRLQLSTPSLDEVNKTLTQYMSSLRPLVGEINAKGAHIVICKLEIRDEKGNLLLNYMLDLQLDSENWWMADGLTMDWFPHPGPGPAP